MSSAAEKRSLTPAKARKLSRKQLIEWLEWNDPNGCYRDAECRLEGFQPLTRSDALALVYDQMSDDSGWVTGGAGKGNPDDIMTIKERRAVVAGLERDIAGFEGAHRRRGKGPECWILPRLRSALKDQRRRLAAQEAKKKKTRKKAKKNPARSLTRLTKI